MDEIFYKSERHGIHKAVYIERLAGLQADKAVYQRTYKSISAEQGPQFLFMIGRAGIGVVQYFQMQVEVIDRKKTGGICYGKQSLHMENQQ